MTVDIILAVKPVLAVQGGTIETDTSAPAIEKALGMQHQFRGSAPNNFRQSLVTDRGTGFLNGNLLRQP